MGLFAKKPPEPEPTRAELVQRHRAMAEDQLRRAAKAGRLEAETVHATRATAHATLALSYQMPDPEPEPQPEPEPVLTPGDVQ